MILYNCKHDGVEYRITKFVDGNPESSYLCTHSECECPAGPRDTCRHRQMLPHMLQCEIVNTHWFYNFNKGLIVDFEGKSRQRHEMTPADVVPTGQHVEEDTKGPPPEHAADALAYALASNPPPAGIQIFNLVKTSPADLFDAIAEAVGEPTSRKHWRRL